MAEYSCNSKECNGRVFDSQPNTSRCIYCGNEDIDRLDRPWLVPTILISGLVLAIGALVWWQVALDEQGRESLRNFQFSGCKDMTACNFSPAALMDDAASCTYDDELRDCNGTCKEDADGDGVCDSQEILGCIDEAACNFDKNATEEESICEYPEPGFTCAGDCVNDKDGDGICDENEVLGCTDSSACNFDADATEPDGSCWYREVGKSCEESASPYTIISCDINYDGITDYVRYRFYPDEDTGVNECRLEVDTSMMNSFKHGDLVFMLPLELNESQFSTAFSACDWSELAPLEQFCNTADYGDGARLFLAEDGDGALNVVLEDNYNFMRGSHMGAFRLRLIRGELYVTRFLYGFGSLDISGVKFIELKSLDFDEGVCYEFTKELDVHADAPPIINESNSECYIDFKLCDGSFLFSPIGFETM